MPTGAEVAALVLQIVGDEGDTEDDVLALFDRCASVITRPPRVLPALDVQETVTTEVGISFVSLPATFQRNLYACDGGNGAPDIEIVPSRAAIFSRYGSLTRPGTHVRCVAAVRPYLVYAPIPITPQTLTLRFQRTQPAITPTLDLETIVPEGFADLFQHYACWKIFEQIEQGTDGKKIDTNYHMALFLGLLEELDLATKREGASLPRPPIAVPERW